MPNKISGYNATDAGAKVLGSSSGVQAADKTQGAAAAAAAGNVPPAGDQVTLTGSARLLQKLSEAVAGAPVVNAAKVASVKLAIQNGTYKVDAGQVADKLMKFERGLE